jgi:E1A/CREB-binding protein
VPPCVQQQARSGSKFTSVANPQKRREREEMVFRTMRLLEHASACSDEHCMSKGCAKVKKLHEHARKCSKNVAGGCALCKHMWCLLNLHAKQCIKLECPVPRCQCASPFLFLIFRRATVISDKSQVVLTSLC